VAIAHSLEAARRGASASGERFDVLLSSGFGTEHDARRSRDAGFAKHLVKPVAIERVVEAIEELAGAPSEGAAPR
jgi:CheY-like chemotaxis protein